MNSNKRGVNIESLSLSRSCHPSSANFDADTQKLIDHYSQKYQKSRIRNLKVIHIADIANNYEFEKLANGKLKNEITPIIVNDGNHCTPFLSIKTKDLKIIIRLSVNLFDYQVDLDELDNDVIYLNINSYYKNNNNKSKYYFLNKHS
jgi:hypothetical protein